MTETRDINYLSMGNSAVLYLTHGNACNDFMEAMMVAAKADGEDAVLAREFAQDVLSQMGHDY